MRAGAIPLSMGFMEITRFRKRKARRPRRAGAGVAAETMSVAAQMALLCPSGMDVWMQRELSGLVELERLSRPGRR